MHFYQDLLNKTMEDKCDVKGRIIDEGPKLSTQQQHLLNCNFIEVDVKRVMHSVHDNKAPDRYNSFFFKKCWEIIGGRGFRCCP